MRYVRVGFGVVRGIAVGRVIAASERGLVGEIVVSFSVVPQVARRGFVES